jgi:acyl-CoA thioester hydrolase
MPHTYKQCFQVRYYECDATGQLQNAAYLRFMQEAAFAASADAGYSHSTYAAMRRLWLIRQTVVDHLAPIRPGCVLEITTWNEGLRRVLARRVYEFREKGSDELAAKGYSDWVFLDRDGMAPASIPTTIVNAFFPEGPPEKPISRRPFPKPSSPTDFHTFRKQVEWRDIDGMGHLTNAAYLAYADDCAVRVASQSGWRFPHWDEKGIGFTTRRNRIEYRQPAFLNDELEITTWLTDTQPSSMTRHYTISRVTDGALIAQIQTLWEITDLTTGKPTQIPASLYGAISKIETETPS